MTYRETLGPIFSSVYLAPASRLAEKGIDVRVVAFSAIGEWLRPPLRKRWRDLKASVNGRLAGQVHRIPSPPSRYRIAWNEARPLTWWLRARYRGQEPVVLHCGSSQATALGLEARRGLPHLKVVYQVWGPEAAEHTFANGGSDRAEAGVRAEAARLDGLQRQAMREADAIISISTAMTRWAVDEYEAEPAKIVEIPCFVDLDRFRPAPQHRSAVRRQLGLGNRFTVVYAGSLFRWQFPDGCFDVLRAVRARIPDTHFLAVTTSPKTMRARLAEHAFPEDATTVISAPYEDVPRYLAAGDLAILGRGLGESPSLVNGISSPVKFGEYLACGAPVVLSEGIGDFSDAAREHELGIVIPHMAGKAVISRLLAEFLVQYRANAGTFRERCRAFACEHLAIDKHVERLAALYEQLGCR